MRDVFLRFALLGGTGGLAALALHFAKPLLRRAPAKWSVWLWLALGIRMLVPLGRALPTPALESLPLPLAAMQIPVHTVTVPDFANPSTSEIAPARTPVDWLGIAIIAWLAGAAMFLAWHVAVYLHARQALLREASALESALLPGLCEEYALRQPRLLRSPAAQTPMAFGLLRPVVVLPMRDYPEQALDCILRHELCHLKARHLPMKALLLAANALHWYNPAAWLLRRGAAAAMEQCCDEMALRGATNERRGAYARALLACAGQRCPAPALTSNWNGGTKEMKARLRNIFTAKPKKTILVTAIVLLCAALAVTAAGIGPGLVAGKAEVRRENDRNAAQIPNAGGGTEDVLLPDPGEDVSAVAQLDDGSKLSVDAEGNYAPLAELGELRNPCPQAGGIMAWFIPEGDPEGMTTSAGRYVEYGAFSGPVEYLSFSGENVLGTEILAAKDGTVARVYEDGRRGNVVELDHGDGFTSAYGSCESILVREGDPVKAGQPIAVLGSTGLSTGPHLSFWLRQNGNCLDGSLYRFAG